jgi:hypothetical protein
VGDAKVKEFTFRLTDTYDVTNNQGVKFEVIGSLAGVTGLMDVVVADKDGNVLASFYGLSFGDTFTVSDSVKLPSEVVVTVYDVDLQGKKKSSGDPTASTLECFGSYCARIHTSCSVPLVVGDTFGNLVADGFTNTVGATEDQCPCATAAPTPPTPAPTRLPTNAPTAPTPAPTCAYGFATDGCTPCAGGAKVADIRFELTEAYAVDNNQGVKTALDGTLVGVVGLMNIEVTDKDGTLIATFVNVSFGDTITISAAALSTDRLASEYTLTVYSQDQGRKKSSSSSTTFVCDGDFCANIHTSCSVPLELGDAFGHFVVDGFKNTVGITESACPCAILPPPTSAPTCVWGADPAGCTDLINSQTCSDSVTRIVCPSLCNSCTAAPTAAPTVFVAAPTAAPTPLPACLQEDDPACADAFSFVGCSATAVRATCPETCGLCYSGAPREPGASYGLDILDLPTSLSALDSEIPISVGINSVDMTESLNLVARLETTGATPTLVGEGVTLIEATSRTRRNAQSTATVTIVIPDSMLPLDMQASYSLKLFMAPAPSVSWDDRIAEAETVSDMKAVSSVHVVDLPTQLESGATTVGFNVNYAISSTASNAVIGAVLTQEQGSVVVGMGDVELTSSHGQVHASVTIPGSSGLQPVNATTTYRIFVFVYTPPMEIIASQAISSIPVTLSSGSSTNTQSSSGMSGSDKAAVTSIVVIVIGIAVLAMIVVRSRRQQRDTDAANASKNDQGSSSDPTIEEYAWDTVGSLKGQSVTTPLPGGDAKTTSPSPAVPTYDARSGPAYDFGHAQHGVESTYDLAEADVDSPAVEPEIDLYDRTAKERVVYEMAAAQEDATNFGEVQDPAASSINEDNNTDDNNDVDDQGDDADDDDGHKHASHLQNPMSTDDIWDWNATGTPMPEGAEEGDDFDTQTEDDEAPGFAAIGDVLMEDSSKQYLPVKADLGARSPQPADMVSVVSDYNDGAQQAVRPTASERVKAMSKAFSRSEASGSSMASSSVQGGNVGRRAPSHSTSASSRVQELAQKFSSASE